jgi:hypothetical protein
MDLPKLQTIINNLKVEQHNLVLLNNQQQDKIHLDPDKRRESKTW